MDNTKRTSERRPAQVLVSHWVCRACGLTGQLVPQMDLEGPPWAVSDSISDILREHGQHTPKGGYHGAFIEVER